MLFVLLLLSLITLPPYFWKSVFNFYLCIIFLKVLIILLVLLLNLYFWFKNYSFYYWHHILIPSLFLLPSLQWIGTDLNVCCVSTDAEATARLPNSQVPQLWIHQPWIENIKNNSRKLSKAKLEFAAYWQLFTSHLLCIRYYK